MLCALGRIYYKVAGGVKGLEWYLRGLEIFKNDQDQVPRDILALVAEACLESNVSGVIDDAGKWAQLSLGVEPWTIQLWTTKGHVLLHQKRRKEALICMNVALDSALQGKEGPDQVACCMKHVGDAQFLAGRKKEALETLRAAKDLWDEEKIENREYGVCLFLLALAQDDLTGGRSDCSLQFLLKSREILQRTNDAALLCHVDIALIIYGIHSCGFDECNEVATKQCSACKSVYYCSEDHQRAHWKTHKAICVKKT